MTHKLALFCSIFLLSACTSVPQKLDSKAFYKRDMDLTINGYQGIGVMVVPRAEEYKFEIEAKGKLDLFTLTTCHREWTKEKAGQKGWFKSKKRRELTFVPEPLESENIACPVQLGGYERINGRHSWGLVSFEHPSLTLPALVSCNGSHYNANGVSTCQAKTGLLMEIKFSEKVLWPKENTCVKLETKDSQTFRFKVPLGQCGFRFVTMGHDEKWHRLITVGYQKILIREN